MTTNSDRFSLLFVENYKYDIGLELLV